MERRGMFSLARIGAMLLMLAAVAAFAAVRPASAQDDVLVIDLGELNDSGVSGTAELTDNGDGTTTVVIQVDGATGGHPAHIHNGTCDDLDPNPLYPLTTVDEDGFSETDVPYTLEDLLANPTAINLHESDTNLGVYIACGNIVSDAGDGDDEEADEETAAEDDAAAEEDGVGGGTVPPATGVGALAGAAGGFALWQGLAAIGGAALAAGALLRRR
ncbi:MAG TPA: hypothetical protein VIL01_04270 [Thermomicrobiales bacterium]